jgi:hypothetical protein
MQKGRKLSSDNELDIKFIVTFTVAFVIISSIILAAGYAVASMTGIIGGGSAAEIDATPTPAPTARPTYVVIGVPTEIPDPTPTPTPRPPTPTPSPTPVPSPYKLKVSIDQSRVGSYIYILIFGMGDVSEPVDMTHTRLCIRNGGAVYCDYNFDEAFYNMYGEWRNSDGDKTLEPGESFSLEVSAYSLNIPLDSETRLILSLDGTELRNFPIPAFQMNTDLPAQPQDPGTGYSY